MDYLRPIGTAYAFILEVALKMDTKFFEAIASSKKSVLVLGAGRSGIAAARLLLKKNINVLLVDDKNEEQLRFFSSANLKSHTRLRTHFGNLASISFDEIALMVMSPGVGNDHVLIEMAKCAGISLISEIDLALTFLSKETIIGVTGTNGKSTTTVMIESIIRAANKKVIAGGNLGLALSEIVVNHEDDLDVIVVELSSFQLENMWQKKLDAAVIVNITPDHLDRHHSFENYVDAKFKIASLLKENASFVVNANLLPLAKKRSLAPQYFDAKCQEIFRDVKIQGDHNLENAVAAATIAQSLGISSTAIIDGLNRAKPLPHRCELIAVKNGISFINDSKGTTVEAVKKALTMFDANTHLLLGGIEKGEDFSMLSQKYFPHVKKYYVFGKAAPTILAALNSSSAIQFCDLKTAFSDAIRNAIKGDVVLLSPGCASYDQFDDYQHRGETFRKLVENFCPHP